MESKSSDIFWKLVNKLKSNEPGYNPDPETFHAHFEQLHQGIKNAHFDLSYKNKLKVKQMKHEQYVAALDKSVTTEELRNVSIDLKNKKACGYDCISNEMIKCSIDIMADVLLKVLNRILNAEKFPNTWT